MKTTGFICAAFCALALVSCVKENVTSQNENGTNAENRITRFTATGADTRTGLSWNAESGLMNVRWSTTDRINVNGVEFTNTEAEASISAVFESTEGVDVAGEYIAVYPSTATINPDGTILANLPAKQTAVNASFSDNLNVSVAKSETTELTFRNVLGMLRFEIAADNIYSVSISGNNDEFLAGDIEISYDEEGNPVAEVIDNEKASKTLTVVSGTDTKVAIPAKTVVYAIVAPQTFEKGITMTFTSVNYATDDVVKASKQGTAIKTSSNPLTVIPSTFKNLGSVGAKMNWYYSGVTLHSQYYSETDEYVSKQGNYLDLETCRTFWPIGSYAYCSEIDMGAAYSTSNNGFSITGFGANAKIGAFYNETNLSAYAGGTASVIDKFGVEGTGWTSRNATYFYQYSADQMNDEKFEALKITANPTVVDGTTTYHNFTDPTNLTGNNGRVQYLDKVITYYDSAWAIQTVYVGFKTATGNPNKYGVIKITAAGGTSKNSFIKFDYIIGK